MNSVFHPSKKNPFQDPPLPQSHYAPSPSKEILDKSVTLTPQKLKHRHEYSLPPEVYTPEQYSILEENSSFNKPPLPTQDNNDAVLNFQQILSDIETWDSVKFCEKWSSRISEVKEDTSTHKAFDKPPPIHGPLSSTIKSETSKQLARTMKEKPIHIQTSFASDRNLSSDYDRTSNIQQRLDRFRFGAPKAPDKRKAEKSKRSTSSGVSINHLRSLKSQNSSPKQSSKAISQSPIKESSLRIRHHTKIPMSESNKTSVQDQDTGPKPPLPPPTSESADVIDTSLSSLNSRLDRLIQQSSSVALSPLSTYKSTVDQSSASILKVSADSTILSSEFASIEKAPELCDDELPRRMLWQKDVSSPQVKQSAATLKENDILYQWRLKRKLEEAREYVDSNQEKPLSKAERPFSAEASRVLQDSTSVNGICSNPTTPKKQNGTLFQPTSQRLPPLAHHFYGMEPMKFYQTSCGCPCVHQLPHVTVSEQAPEKQDTAVRVTERVSIETQTGRSLVFSDDAYSNGPSLKQGGISDENQTKPACVNTFPHTSTPASTVSFHRVKIVEAEPENSPQTVKDSAEAQNVSPVSYKTDVTTLWSSTDHKRMIGSQSPVSSVPSSHQRHGSDAEPCSPTANVVKEVVGSHLFNTTRSSSTTSAISRLKNRKKLHDQKSKPTLEKDACLNGSYTECSSSDKKVPKSDNGCQNPLESNQGSETIVKSPISEHRSSHDDDDQAGKTVCKTPPLSPMKPLSPVEELQCTGEADETVLENSMEEDDEFDFDPAEFFDKILKDVMGDQYGLSNKMILKELRTQKDHILEEFRQIADEIESCDTSNL